MTLTRSWFRAIATLAAAASLLIGGLVAASPAGATAHAQPSSAARLAAATAALERSVPFAGTAWGVDTARQQVVVWTDRTVTGSRLAAVRSTVSRLGGTARFEQVRGVFRPYISGGDAIYGSKYRCSLGFNVVDSAGAHYFLTAGHCGKSEPQWWTSANHTTLLGSTVNATFPGKDYALVRYSAGYTNYQGTVGSQDITSAANAFVGEAVTRRGSTTGIHTGKVSALNVTVRYASGGTVRGLIQTNVCAEPGDSGGPLYDGTKALGLTSGGSGDCTSGGTTFFQPVTAALSAYAVSVY